MTCCATSDPLSRDPDPRGVPHRVAGPVIPPTRSRLPTTPCPDFSARTCSPLEGRPNASPVVGTWVQPQPSARCCRRTAHSGGAAMTAEHGASHGVTTVAPGAVTRVIAWVGLPAVGGVLGWLLSTLAEWAASLPWVPYRGPIELIASLPQPQATLGCVGLGVVVGLVLAVVAEREFVK